MKTFYEWRTQEAQWYYFWRPQSGLLGGTIFGSLIVGRFYRVKYDGDLMIKNT